MKKLLLTLMTISLISACSTMSQDFSIGAQLNSIKSNPAASKYSKVTSRAEKAYYAGNLKMAQNLLNIVKKKIATNSPY